MSTPPSKKAKLNDVTIQELPEALLAKVFSYLPLEDRFQLPAVCKQWQCVSRISWTDASYLNASDIPNKKINTILGLCPKLKEFIAHDRMLDLETNQNLLGSSLRSLRLYETELNFKRKRSTVGDSAKFKRLVAQFFADLSNLEELVWHYVYMQNKMPGTRGYAANVNQERGLQIPVSITMVASLRRLKIVNDIAYDMNSADIMSPLAQLVNLQCLHLEGIIQPGHNVKQNEALGKFLGGLAPLAKLRELCVAQVTLLSMDGEPISLKGLAALLCEQMPQLEVLMFVSNSSIEPAGISRLVTSHPGLRILVLAGGDDALTTPLAAPPVVIPARKIKAGVHGHGPSSILHVFVGGNILRRVRFTLPEAKTTKFWPIDRKMPEFLAKPDVAEVFEGVWLANMIREAVSVGEDYWVWGGPFESSDFYTPALGEGPRASAAAEGFWSGAQV